jgi:hypothetical protein
LKFRIEEPFVTIYSNDEQLLFDIVRTTGVKEIHRPASEEAKQILNRGQLVVKTKSDYTYKIVLRESSKISLEVREQVYNYLTSLGDTVKLTRSCKRNLTERRHWFTSTYFYSKDSTIMTFLNLISPDIVSGIFELAVATDK